ncbi:MAG: PAS domain-containing protein [Campylobacterota bacterium]|nr:PAS domain-containing protein [Campylobacterota bacterium]
MNNSSEYKLTSKSFLLSETDQKGIIRFANEEFCQVSGYALDELVGNPHNMVRHTDMPKAAFKELWETVQKGNTWKGFVKNKTKDGGYYWVFATVFPFTSCDGSQGYISCRQKASDDEIEKYSNLYKTMQ